MTNVHSNVLSIGELAHRTGLTAHTIRFYESTGVLKPVGRASSGHRRYHADDIQWLEFVLRLKATGMPLAEIKRYAELRARGESTLSDRLALLELHRERLRTKLAELSNCAQALDDKIRLYTDLLSSAKTSTR
jgi:DNA-binding transcriptional MerR regulator